MCISDQKLFRVINLILLVTAICVTIFNIFYTVFDHQDAFIKTLTFVFCAVLIINGGCSHRLRRSECGSKFYTFCLSIMLMTDIIVLMVLGLKNRSRNTWNMTTMVIWGVLGCFVLIVINIGSKISHALSSPSPRHEPLT